MSDSRSPRVLVVGAGFGGLGVAAELLRRGHADVTVLERADDVGGVWRDNHYPGAACDVPSSLYSWSWAQNPGWRHRYARQPEILAYLRDVAERHGLRERVRTGQRVTGATWDETSATWTVTTATGTTYVADVLVPAVGQLSDPVVPDLPGADTFTGPAFHSAAWRHDVDLRGRRVAVVGTGASAIQVVPAIVDDVAALTVLQRSAPYVVPKPDGENGPLRRRLVARVPALLRAERRVTFAVTEWFNRRLTGDGRTGPVRALWRVHLRRQVRDADLRARLVPDHELGCKRVLFSNDWYPALVRDHVAVVGEAVAAVEPDGVRTADGVLHPADVLVWGTGFAATRFLAGLEVVGRDGRSLADVWADGAHAHLGMTVPGFPNLCLVYGPHTNLGGSSVIGMLEAQAGWIGQAVDLLAAGASPVEVDGGVAAAYDEEVQARLADTVWASCASWYREPSGRVGTNWPGTVTEYRRRTAVLDPAHLTSGRDAGAEIR